MKKIEKLNNKTKIALTVLAIAVVGVFAQNQLGVDSDQKYNGESSEPNTQTMPMPPSNLLKQIGVRSSFDEAKSKIGLVDAFTPTNIPKGLVMESVRHIIDPNGNRMLILYLPDGKTTSEETSIRQVIENGMVIEVVREKSDDSVSWNDYVTKAVTENPSIRSSTMIGDHKVLLIKKNPEINYPNMAKIVFGNTRIEVASDQIEPTDLVKVLQSLVG